MDAPPRLVLALAPSVAVLVPAVLYQGTTQCTQLHRVSRGRHARLAAKAGWYYAAPAKEAIVLQSVVAPSASSSGVQVEDVDERNSLWLALIQLEIGGSEGAPGDVAHRVEAIDRWIGDRLMRGTLSVEDALGLLPEQEMLRDYKRVLLKHMEASTQQVRLPACRSRRMPPLSVWKVVCCLLWREGKWVCYPSTAHVSQTTPEQWLQFAHTQLQK